MSKSSEANARWHLVPCEGGAHCPEAGGMIDHCLLCAPRWGVVLVPVQCKTHHDWRAFRDSFKAGSAERVDLMRERAAVDRWLLKAGVEARRVEEARRWS